MGRIFTDFYSLYAIFTRLADSTPKYLRYLRAWHQLRMFRSLRRRSGYGWDRTFLSTCSWVKYCKSSAGRMVLLPKLDGINLILSFLISDWTTFVDNTLGIPGAFKNVRILILYSWTYTMALSLSPHDYWKNYNLYSSFWLTSWLQRVIPGINAQWSWRTTRWWMVV